MTPKQQLKNLIERLPEEKVILVQAFLKNLLKEKELKPPKGKLGIKERLNRKGLYDDILAHRY
jgi:SOS response regulatory protein OraA/RecX